MAYGWSYSSCEAMDLFIEGIILGRQERQPYMIRVSMKSIPRIILSWIFDAAKQLTKERFRYITLSPPFIARQRFVAKRSKGFHDIWVRDSIDLVTFQQIFAHGEYVLERLVRFPEIRNLYNNITLAGRRPLILDCGANIGCASVHFALDWPGAKIVALEPDESNLAQARKNATQFDVEFLLAAVGSRAGKVDIVDPGMGNNALRVEFDDDGGIPLVTIPDLLAKFPPAKFVPFIAKVDIEGFEEQLFSENLEWIAEFPVLMIELHDWMHAGTANSRNFLKAIADSGRDFVYFNETIFSLRNPMTGRLSPHK